MVLPFFETRVLVYLMPFLKFPEDQGRVEGHSIESFGKQSRNEELR